MRGPTRLLLVLLLFCVGCEPEDTPCFSPDGKEVAFLIEPERGNAEVPTGAREVGILTLADGKIRTFTLPGKWTAHGLVWAGPRLIVNVSRPREVIKVQGQTREGLYLVLDRATGKFAETPLKSPLLRTPFAGRFQGKPCIYVANMETKQTKAYRPDDFKEIGSLPFGVKNAGRQWFIHTATAVVTKPIIEGEHTKWILESMDPDKRTATRKEMTGVEVFDPNSRKVCTLAPGEIAKACWRGAREPLCARVFADGTKIFLGFGTDTIFRQCPTEYTFGVFDTRTGVLLWKGASNALRGIPVATSDAVYILEARERKRYTGERTAAALVAGPARTSEPTSELVLARHTAKGRDVVVDVKLGDGEQASRYSASPDGKTIVVLVEGPKPRLLLIPVRKRVATGELRSVPLTVK